LTSDEEKLFEFATVLGDWLEPHHNHIRPPPSAVMSEVARLTEQKTGQQLKGFSAPEIETNGHVKKDEEPPAVQEPSEIITRFFSSTFLSALFAYSSISCTISQA
jgi:N-terminal acetyltransferase B complex non-catalytic subunit